MIVEEGRNFREFVRKPVHEQEQQHKQQILEQQRQEAEFLEIQLASTPHMLPGALSSAGVLTNTDSLQFSELQLDYDGMPKPQELKDYALMSNTNDSEMFLLEEELSFGLDRGYNI